MGSRVMRVRAVSGGDAGARRYRLTSCGAEWTLAEWLGFAREIGCDRLEAREADGSRHELEVKGG